MTRRAVPSAGDQSSGLASSGLTSSVPGTELALERGPRETMRTACGERTGLMTVPRLAVFRRSPQPRRSTPRSLEEFLWVPSGSSVGSVAPSVSILRRHRTDDCGPDAAPPRTGIAAPVRGPAIMDRWGAWSRDGRPGSRQMQVSRPASWHGPSIFIQADPVTLIRWGLERALSIDVAVVACLTGQGGRSDEARAAAGENAQIPWSGEPSTVKESVAVPRRAPPTPRRRPTTTRRAASTRVLCSKHAFW